MYRAVEECKVGVEYCPFDPREHRDYGSKNNHFGPCGGVIGKLRECLDISYFAGASGTGVNHVETLRMFLFPVADIFTCEMFAKRTVGKDGTARCHGKVATTNLMGYWKRSRTWERGSQGDSLRVNDAIKMVFLSSLGNYYTTSPEIVIEHTAGNGSHPAVTSWRHVTATSHKRV
jgi:hypothetical protein